MNNILNHMVMGITVMDHMDHMDMGHTGVDAIVGGNQNMDIMDMDHMNMDHMDMDHMDMGLTVMDHMDFIDMVLIEEEMNIQEEDIVGEWNL